MTSTLKPSTTTSIILITILATNLPSTMSMTKRATRKKYIRILPELAYAHLLRDTTRQFSLTGRQALEKLIQWKVLSMIWGTLKGELSQGQLRISSSISKLARMRKYNFFYKDHLHGESKLYSNIQWSHLWFAQKLKENFADQIGSKERSLHLRSLVMGSSEAERHPVVDETWH